MILLCLFRGHKTRATWANYCGYPHPVRYCIRCGAVREGWT